MRGYIIKRLLISFITIFVVSVFVYMLLHLIPGDPVYAIYGNEITQEQYDILYREMNLDKPVIVQYGLWLVDAVNGDLGESICYGVPVASLLGSRLAATVSVGLPAMVISSVLGVLIGVVCAVKRGTAVDSVLTVFTTASAGTPVFWIAILLVYIFALQLHVFPVQGYVAPTKDFGDFLYKATLPIICTCFGFIATIARQTRSNMLEVINQDYIRTARANGLPKRKVIYSHALRNALIPIITLIGLQVRMVIGGSLIVERLFNIPGMGNLLVTALLASDYITGQGVIVFITVITVLANFAVDLLYGVVDPRIRLAKG